jgi:hypothetical protein
MSEIQWILNILRYYIAIAMFSCSQTLVAFARKLILWINEVRVARPLEAGHKTNCHVVTRILPTGLCEVSTSDILQRFHMW